MPSKHYAQLYEISEYGKALDRQLLEQGLLSDDAHDLWLSIKIVGQHRLADKVPSVFKAALSTDWPEGVDGESIAAWTLSEIKTDDVSKEVLILAGSENPRERRFAADALGLLKSTTGFAKLQELCKDQAYDVKLWSFLSLSKYGDEALPFLKELALSTEDEVDVVLINDAISKILT